MRGEDLLFVQACRSLQADRGILRQTVATRTECTYLDTTTFPVYVSETHRLLQIQFKQQNKMFHRVLFLRLKVWPGHRENPDLSSAMLERKSAVWKACFSCSSLQLFEKKFSFFSVSLLSLCFGTDPLMEREEGEGRPQVTHKSSRGTEHVRTVRWWFLCKSHSFSLSWWCH